MTYFAAYLLLSALAAVACYFLTHDTDNDDEYETTSAINGRSLRAVHVAATRADAVEENDAAIGALASTTARGE